MIFQYPNNNRLTCESWPTHTLGHSSSASGSLDGGTAPAFRLEKLRNKFVITIFRPNASSRRTAILSQLLDPESSRVNPLLKIWKLPSCRVTGVEALSMDGDDEPGVCSSAHASEERASKCYINNQKSLEDRQHFSDHVYQSFSLQGEVREISLSLTPLL